jgi:glycosyltransferase involved in cell wall biosynthesis
LTYEDGVAVRRFPTEHPPSRSGLRAQRAIQDGAVPGVDEQWSWVSWRFRVPELFHHLLRHGTGYDAVVFSPYMFWTTTACLSAVTANAVVMPCLHDETYARLDVMRPVLADPASVWFLSEPEHQLAHRLGRVAPRHTVTGAGVAVPDSYDPAGFRAKHGLERPFLLYAGRREREKGWDWLVDTFGDALARSDTGVDLVTIGVGEASAPNELKGRVIDLGFLPEQQRNDAFAAALAYVQPSRMESFSRTIMESWLARTPVLVIEGSEVVAWHCKRSGGGFEINDGADLARCVERLVGNPDLAAEVAERGRRYVIEEYAWSVVLDRMEADLRSLAESGAT